MSAFALRDGQVFHTYSAYRRAAGRAVGMYQWLDRAPLGRNETAGEFVVAPARQLRDDGVVIAHVAGVPVEELLPLAWERRPASSRPPAPGFSEALRRRRPPS
jgi:hypothetical protein